MIKMDIIKAPTKIEHPVYEAEFMYIPASETKTKEISGFDDTGTRIKISRSGSICQSRRYMTFPSFSAGERMSKNSEKF